MDQGTEDGRLITQELSAVLHVLGGDGGLRLTKAVEVEDRMMEAEEAGPKAEEQRCSCDQEDGTRECRAIAGRLLLRDENL